MSKKWIIGAVIIMVPLLAVWLYRAQITKFILPPPHPLVLQGNIDDRRLNLAFSLSERIAEFVPEEGAFVKKGDVLAKLETVRIEHEITSSRAMIAAARAAVSAGSAELGKLRNGSRLEDIAIARGGVAALGAKAKALQNEYLRQKHLLDTKASSVQTMELAEADYLFYQAALTMAQSFLQRLQTGNRAEDIAIAEAKLEQMQAELEQRNAQLVICEQRLKDTVLRAPCDGIVRKRLLEPGEMTFPNTPVLILAVTSPKWVRVFMPESLLPQVRFGDPAKIRVDGADGEFDGRVGYIAPNAEFTPKNVETPELRTLLSYEYRVYLDDPQNVLKLGAPATVTFPQVKVK